VLYIKTAKTKMMKRLFTIIAGVLISASVFAQAPESMSYQAVVRAVRAF